MTARREAAIRREEALAEAVYNIIRHDPVGELTQREIADAIGEKEWKIRDIIRKHPEFEYKSKSRAPRKGRAFRKRTRQDKLHQEEEHRRYQKASDNRAEIIRLNELARQNGLSYGEYTGELDYPVRCWHIIRRKAEGNG